MEQLDAAPGTVAFKDRKIGLIIFGVLTALMGCFCALLGVMMALTQAAVAAAGKAPPPNQPVWLVPVFFGGIAAGMIWLGVGSILARRWARTLLLIASSAWLITGTIGLAFMAAMAPALMKAMEQQAESDGKPMPPRMGAAVIVMMAVMFSCMYFILPACWTLFYRSRHVKATCEALNPAPCWTDRCPTTVLAVSLWLAITAPFMLVMPAAYHSVVPFFGSYLSGPAGAVIYVVSAIAFAWAAWGMYRLDVRAWWLTVAMFVLYSISSVITTSRTSLEEMYRQMQVSPEQLEQIRQFGDMGGRGMAWMSLLFTVAILGYMGFIKKHFRGVGA